MALREIGVDLSGSQNMFGTIARGYGNLANIDTRFGFIPTDGEGGILDLKGDSVNVGASWLGLKSKNMQFWAYNYCPPLATVIDRIAEADTNGRLTFIDQEGKILKKEKINKVPSLSRISKLFSNPNPMQTWEEFNSQQLVYCKVFGYCPVFCISPAGMDKSYTKYMFNFNPMDCTVTWNYEYNIFADKNSINSNVIKSWHINILGTTYDILAEDILLVKDGYMDRVNEVGLPLSKTSGLDYYISNICAAMEADNVLLKKKGPLGVFSHDSKPDLAGMVPMTPAGQEDLQDQLKKYGLTLGQLQYVVSKYPVKWNAMSFNLRDLMTKETVKQGVDGICDRFGYPAEMMAGKDATYDNKNMVEKQLYQNNIIPFSLRRMARYNYFFGLNDTSYEMIMTYDHLAVLQEDVIKAAQSREAYSNSIQIDWEGGRISYNEARLLQKLEQRFGYDEVYYPEYLKLHPEMAPKGNEGQATKKTKYDRKITKEQPKA